MTLTTVGYGDFFPVTMLGRITGLFVMFAGVGIIGALASILASLLVSPSAPQEPAPPEAPDAEAAPAPPRRLWPSLPGQTWRPRPTWPPATQSSRSCRASGPRSPRSEPLPDGR